LFGEDAGPALVSLISQGTDGVEELRKKIRETGSVMSEDAVRAAEKFNDSLELIGRTIGAFRVELFSGLVQELASIADFLANTERGAEALSKVLDRLKIAAVAFGAYMGTRFVLQMGAAITQFVIAERRIAALTAQKAALAAQAGVTAGAVGTLGRAVTLAFGPVGVAVAAIGAIASIGLAMRDAASEANSLDERIRQLTASQS